MKYTTTILASLMAVTVVAQPHVRHQHAARHEKRDIVWVTDSIIITKTVDYTTTVWVSAGQVAAASASAPSVTPTTLATIPKSPAAAYTAIPEGAILDQKPSSSSVVDAPSSSTSVPAPVPTTTSVAPVVIPTTSVAPVPTTTSVAPVVAPVPTTTSVAPVVAPTSTSVAVVPSSNSAPSSSSGGVCASGAPCTGDITFYEAGLGACGQTNDGSSFSGVALPVGLMGAQSNGNPYCGKTITIKMPSGKTTTATVIDKCMGCMGNSIDLTTFAFDKLAEPSVGRTQATWWFN